MITIRTATPRDLPALRDMIRKLCALHGDPCHLGLAEAQTRFIDGPLTALIALQDDQPIGYAVLEPRWRPMTEGDTLDIAHLFIEEPLRGQGIGRRLIETARQIADYRKADRLTIGTATENPCAAAAYRAMGLEEITTTPGPRFSVPL
ncbi:GNAT family N-acetyltransferase [Loktanella agnita]|uniref:GNAT family N-acetyltransferase n=1 Tax=Loktanella agnita TaxID=287097 RepID=UPI003985DBBD